MFKEYITSAQDSFINLTFIGESTLPFIRLAKKCYLISDIQDHGNIKGDMSVSGYPIYVEKLINQTYGRKFQSIDFHLNQN
ncbi:hypothetical protein C5S31_04655 [ANME-1 cluster archaeon GoMg2]|nr:hypothetical protein [ANME-1 cluster archaeon GoMg2]